MKPKSSSLRGYRGALLLVVGLSGLPGCLEGDPNPLAQGGQSSTSSGGTPGYDGDETSSGVARSSSPPGSSIEPGAVCSESSFTPVRLNFENRYAARTLDLYWVNYDCGEVFYTSLAPGGPHGQDTYAGHPWRLREGGRLLHEYVATDAPSQSVPLP